MKHPHETVIKVDGAIVGLITHPVARSYHVHDYSKPGHYVGTRVGRYRTMTAARAKALELWPTCVISIPQRAPDADAAPETVEVDPAPQRAPTPRASTSEARSK